MINKVMVDYGRGRSELPAAARLCLYGTVFNSSDTVELSVRSVFRPDADIVVVDGGSTDGTYERLLEISKDYNLKVYRLPGSSRGLGRNYALQKCPEESYAAYFDLDDEYNEYFHESVEWGMAQGAPNPLYYLVSRDYAIAKGGWRDLNFAEDVEFFARVGFRYHFPVLFRRHIDRPSRRHVRPAWLFDSQEATSMIAAIKRSFRSAVDLVRGTGFAFAELMSSVRPVLRPAAAVAFAAAAIEGIYRYDEHLNNHDLMFKYMIGGLVDPVKEIGAREQDVVFLVPETTARRLGLDWVLGRLQSVGLRTFRCRQGRAIVVVGVRTPNALRAPERPLRFSSCSEI